MNKIISLKLLKDDKWWELYHMLKEVYCKTNDINLKKTIFILTAFIFTSSLFASKDAAFTLFQDCGKYNVGFKRIYTFDSNRKYPFYLNPKINNDTSLTARPMIINAWYPCQKDKIKESTYSQYLTFNAPDSSWKNFIDRIIKFNRGTIINNVFRRTPLNDTIKENMLFDDLLKMETSIFVDAEPISKEFPLIIAQPGLGGSIEENALLYEFLASHGYYIVTCAYQSNTGKIMHPDWDLERSFKDVEFLMNYSKSHFKINENNMHLMGFSFGAQSNFNILIKENSFKSAISFDSRFESSYSYNPRGYNSLPKKILESKDKFTTPILLFTNQSAPYLIIDSLIYSERNYVMVKDYKHYDFTAIKEVGYSLILKKITDAALKRKVNNYSLIANFTLSFLNFQSSNSSNTFSFANEDVDGFWFEKMKRGDSSPILILNDKLTPRQAILSVENQGVEAVKRLYPEYKSSFTENMLNDYAYYLMSKQKGDLAAEVLLWAIETFPNSSNLYDSLGEAYFFQKDYKLSISAYKKSLLLNPNNNNAAKMINKIDGLE